MFQKKKRKIKVPKDLGVKIGSADEVLFTEQKQLEEMQIAKFEKAIKNVPTIGSISAMAYRRPNVIIPYSPTNSS